VVVSHDRYFIERVTDNVYALPGDGSLRHLPGGMDQYLTLDLSGTPGAATDRVAPVLRRGIGGSDGDGAHTGSGDGDRAHSGSGDRAQTRRAGAAARASRKQATRLEREIERSSEREHALQQQMADHARDHVRLAALQGELRALLAEREQLEGAWLQAAQVLE
jgi:ATP-binding cassette subfamily F protein uup